MLMWVLSIPHTHPIYPTRRIEPWLKEKERNRENHLAEKHLLELVNLQDAKLLVDVKLLQQCKLLSI